MSAETNIERIDVGRDHSRSIGTILVEQGRLSPGDVDKIQRFAREHRVRFGDAALRLQLLTETDIDAAVAQQFNYPILSLAGEHAVTDDVVAAYNPQSELVEPLRALRSQLALRWLNNANRRVLAVTSPSRHEGRSWLAANLATVFAQLGDRTLLIDADMRNPSQHKLFNINNSVGLSALLTGRVGREIIRRIHPQLRLFVLVAGMVPPNPQELLGRPVFDVMLEQLDKQFDVIVIDTPPVTETADAQIISAKAGAALMMVRLNHTKHKLLEDAMRSFADSGVNIVGSVCNEH